MRTAAWTYEIPPAAAGAVGLEDYQVEGAGGEPFGKLKVVVRREDDLFVVVEGGTPPLHRDVRAFPWRCVGEIDHEAVTVRLAADADAEGFELDPANAIEGDRAEARRITGLPGEAVPPAASPGAPGPVDRPSYVGALALSLLGVFAALAVVAIGSASDNAWVWALGVVPALLLAVGGVATYRFFRRPSDRL